MATPGDDDTASQGGLSVTGRGQLMPSPSMEDAMPQQQCKLHDYAYRTVAKLQQQCEEAYRVHGSEPFIMTGKWQGYRIIPAGSKGKPADRQN